MLVNNYKGKKKVNYIKNDFVYQNNLFYQNNYFKIYLKYYNFKKS